MKDPAARWLMTVAAIGGLGMSPASWGVPRAHCHVTRGRLLSWDASSMPVISA